MQDAPDYDPGSWIGEIEPPSPFANAWKLNPVGAMVVSSGETSGSVWWASSLDDVALRACLFDDKFVMHPNGEFDNDMGAETWLESFQVASEGCGAPLTR